MENPFCESPSSRVAPVAATENTRPTAAPQNINLNTTRHSTDILQHSTQVGLDIILLGLLAFDRPMCGYKLETVDEEKDLGVILSNDLKWDKQCSQAVKKANRMLGVIKKKF